MNEVGCQRAIQKLIEDNKGILTYGHYHQGSYRAIEEITLSVLTPPREYYHVKIQVGEVSESSFGPRPGNEAKPRRRPVYNCVVHVVDAALPSGIQGAEQYELMHTDFTNMLDGMTALICGSYWQAGGSYGAQFMNTPLCLTDPVTGAEYSLVRDQANDRLVRKQNLHHTWVDPDSEVWTPLLYSTLTFRLEQRIV